MEGISLSLFCYQEVFSFDKKQKIYAILKLKWSF